MKELKLICIKVAKRILCYIKSTITYGLLYSFFNIFLYIDYSDSDWGGALEDQKNIIEFVFYMGDTAFTWYSKK